MLLVSESVCPCQAFPAQSQPYSQTLEWAGKAYLGDKLYLFMNICKLRTYEVYNILPQSDRYLKQPIFILTKDDSNNKLIKHFSKNLKMFFYHILSSLVHIFSKENCDEILPAHNTWQVP